MVLSRHTITPAACATWMKGWPMQLGGLIHAGSIFSLAQTPSRKDTVKNTMLSWEKVGLKNTVLLLNFTSSPVQFHLQFSESDRPSLALTFIMLTYFISIFCTYVVLLQFRIPSLPMIIFSLLHLCFGLFGSWLDLTALAQDVSGDLGKDFAQIFLCYTIEFALWSSRFLQEKLCRLMNSTNVQKTPGPTWRFGNLQRTLQLTDVQEHMCAAKYCPLNLIQMLPVIT